MGSGPSCRGADAMSQGVMTLSSIILFAAQISRILVQGPRERWESAKAAKGPLDLCLLFLLALMRALILKVNKCHSSRQVWSAGGGWCRTSSGTGMTVVQPQGFGAKNRDHLQRFL